MSATYVFVILSIISTVIIFAEGRVGFEKTEQDWGHITVRPHAHMFWWLYYTTAPVSNYTERPLLIWLQGGPGMPSSGYGNFYEIGPLDLDLKPRNHSWVKDFNVMFIDNPVGVGFSYFSDNQTNFPKSDYEIGTDLTTFMELFLEEHPEFQKVPLYIFGESYGGKMVVEFAYQLSLKIRGEKLKCNLQAIGLGDAFISPPDYVEAFGPLAYNLGLIDEFNYKMFQEQVDLFKELYKNGSYVKAETQDDIVISILLYLVDGIDLYNFNTRTKRGDMSTIWKGSGELDRLLNKRVKLALNLSEDLHWSHYEREIRSNILADFVLPVTDKVEKILNETDIKVVVYNGVLDVIVPTSGTIKWVNNLKWKGSEDWPVTQKEAFNIDDVTEGSVKRLRNLVLYVVFRAGHSVPIDNPIAMDYIFKNLTGTESVTEDEKM